MLRILGLIGKWLGIGVLALLAAGFAYQQIGSLVDAQTIAPVGRLVAVDGHRVHMVCKGSGDRTYVLDAGLGAWSVEWYRLQPMLAKSGRVCGYDRPGYGASDDLDHAYDGVTAADELHDLIRAAGIRTPFVYVGHSLGGNFAQIYAGRYPKDVEALILIEPGVPKDLLDNFDPISRTDALAMSAACSLTCNAARAAGIFGIPRFIVHFVIPGTHSLGDDPAAIARYHAEASRSSAAAAGVAYFAALPKTAYQTTEIRSFGALPVLILASAIAPPPDGPGDDMVKWRRNQLAYFASLAAKSSHGVGPVTIANSTHASMVMGKEQSARTIAIIQSFMAKIAR